MDQIQIIGRQKAIDEGLSYYFTGQPCKRGHLSQRDIKKRDCLACRKLIQSIYYQDHREERDQKNQNWILNNRERHSQNQRRWRQDHRDQQHDYHVNWRNINREHLNAKQSEWARNNKEKRAAVMQRYRTNILAKIADRLRSRLRRAIHTHAKTGSAVRDLGCSIQDFKLYLQDRFSSEMTWDNWGSTWELDHIRPLVSFNLANREDILLACHYTNLQPLLIEEHKRKTTKDRLTYS